MFRRIEPARVVIDASGAPFNPDYGDVYASRDGALGQARHVFLRGNDLPQRWAGRDQFVILETGFGLGVNFLAAWQAWRDDPQRPRRMHFVSVEKHPVDGAVLQQSVPAALAALARELGQAWPLPMAGVHRRAFESGCLSLTLVFGDVADTLAQIVVGADAFFLDGFTPGCNPAMWSPAVMKALARCARDGATLATWCTARVVRDGLAAAGFDVTLADGFGHKKQMLRARFAPRWRVRRHEPPVPYAGARSAIVIGAGLAGATAAWSLARRGWQVAVIEREPTVAAGASALPWGLLHPHLSVDDNDADRLTRAGFFMMRALLEVLAPDGSFERTPVWRSDGMFVQAGDDDAAARWEAFARSDDLPAAFAQWCTPREALARCGVRPRQPGWWFPQAAMVASGALCAALIDAGGIALRTGSAVARLRRTEAAWIAEDSAGNSLGEAAVCVVANAFDAVRLLGIASAPVRNVRGRLSRLRAPALESLRAPMSGGGTLVPIGDGWVLAGSTYETLAGESVSCDDSAEVHAGNQRRMARLLAAPVESTPEGIFDGMRCVARDRLPLAGNVADEAAALERRRTLRGAHLADLPRQPGLYANFALGSRGLALAPLNAEWIGAQVEGEPWPIERDLGARIDVARFLLQRTRRQAP